MAKAKVTVTATDNLAKGLNQSKKQLNDFEKYVANVGGKISKAFSVAALSAATVAAFKAMGAAAKQCVQEYAEVEKVSQRLEAVWANVGSATGKTSSEIDAYAESLEKVTYFSSESIKESALLLAATESLTEDGFKRALDVSVDLAAALGEDVTAAAQTLAKAIQEPEAALSRLKTIGVSFTDEEKAQIKALTDANKTYEAQAMILDKVEQKYQGVAKAINNTPAGTLDNIRDTLGDIRENIGGTLLDVISPALESIYGWLLKISEWAGDNRANNKVITAAQNGTGLYMFTEAELTAALDEIWTRIGNMSGAEAEYWASRGTTPWDDALNAINAALRALKENEKWMARQGMIPGGVAPSTHVATADFSLNGNFGNFGLLGTKMDYSSTMSILGRDKVLSMRRSDLDNVLEKFGKYSADYQIKLLDDEINGIKDLLPSTDGEMNTWLKQILSSLLEQRYENPLKELDATFGGTLGYASGEHENNKGMAFNNSVMSTMSDKMGKAGEVAGKLATNMATMGPLLGAIATALEYVFEGLSETLGPALNEMTETVIIPLVEIGKAVGAILLPIIEILNPVLENLAKGLIIIAGTFQYIGQVLHHWIAGFVNMFSWATGYRMSDPGSPGSYTSFIDNKLNSFDSSVSGSVGTETAVSSASYRGATSVTINIYQEGPVVGDGGMREFAQMIRAEFEALDYYGVGA